MNYRAIGSVVSYVFLFLAAAMAVSAGIGVAMGDSMRVVWGVAEAAVVTFLAGMGLRLLSWGRHEISVREAILLTVISWVALGLAGALPFLLSGVNLSWVDAIFESVSGFTTTGASVIPSVSALPRVLLLWRAVTHFIGGMGVIMLCVAVLPLLGGGGMQLFRAEVPGPFKDRLTPRITDTARILWMVYIGLNLVVIVALRLAGMDWLDAVCHAFAALATGGFSTKDTSILFFHSPVIESILMVAMIFGAVNFTLHFAALRGRDLRVYARDAEFRFFIGILAAGVTLAALALWCSGYRWGAAWRSSAFSVVSLATTTGFSTDDFARWPAFGQAILLVVMIMGGCSGSTAGAIKQFRLVAALKDIRVRVHHLLHPQGVFQVKVNQQIVPNTAVSAMVAYVALYLLVSIAAILIMCLLTNDGTVAISSVIAAMGGVGPGLGGVGPLSNYGALPDAAKWVLMGCMILGRLEILAVFALFTPRFWRK